MGAESQEAILKSDGQYAIESSLASEWEAGDEDQMLNDSNADEFVVAAHAIVVLITDSNDGYDHNAATNYY